MLEILNTVSSLLKKKQVTIDTVANQLVHRLLFFCLVGFSAVSQLRQFSSEHLTCTTTREELKQSVDHYCTTLGTYTYPPLDDPTLWAANIEHRLRRNLSISAWVEAYPGIYPYRDIEPMRIYNRNSMFLPIFFIVMASISYFPNSWWRKVERKLMLHLVQELNQPCFDEEREDKQIESSGRHFIGSLKDHKRYALNYLMLHLFNASLLHIHLFLVYYIVDTDYVFYGYEAFNHLDVPPESRPHGLARRLTLAGKCEFRHWSMTMDLLLDNAICVIHLNKVYQLLMALYWWVVCLALIGTYVGLFSHGLKIICPALRRKELQYLVGADRNTDEEHAICRLNFGSGFVLYMMCKNMEPHIILKVLAEVSTSLDTSKDD
ncbi:Innexin inx2 [Orchesella cincta]|uniref:Innexin n=1 Tax=Orchesella cincta TaxID=48709 RepID=A0A1D2M2A2_ORCCI|nr:Innexin inx2 [Orchesella cincta]